MAVWKNTFVSDHLNTDQSQVTKCFELIAFFTLAVLAISANRAARANQAKSGKDIGDYLYHVFLLTYTHLR